MDEITKLAIAVIVFFVVGVYLRSYYNKKCRDNILCEFITDEDTGYKKFFPVREGVLYIEPNKRRAGAEYAVGKMITYNVDYPDGVPPFMSWIQTKAKKAIFDEATAEPLTNRTPMLLLTPQRLYNKDRERYTGIAAGQSLKEEKERGEQVKPPSKGISWKWIIFLLIGIGIAAAIIFKDYLGGISNAALGIG